MLFKKKYFLYAMSLLAAFPGIALASSTRTTTTTTVTNSNNNPSATITLPFNKKTGEEILGGTIAVATVAVIYGLYRLYQKWGGPKDFNQFLKEADLRAQSVIKAHDALNKKISKSNYQELTDQQKIEITQKAYEGYFADNASKLFGLESGKFETWFNSLGDTIEARSLESQTIINSLTADPRSEIPRAVVGEQPFKSALRYAVENDIATQLKANEASISFPKTRIVDPVTGEGASESFASGLGRATRGAVNSAGETAGELANGAARAGRGIADAARALPGQAKQFRDGYSAADQSPLNFGGSDVAPRVSTGGSSLYNDLKANVAMGRRGMPSLVSDEAMAVREGAMARRLTTKPAMQRGDDDGLSLLGANDPVVSVDNVLPDDI